MHGPQARQFHRDGCLPPGTAARIPVRAIVGTLAIAAVMVFTSCSGSPGPVKISGAPDPTGADRSACLRLAAGLPASLGKDFQRREVRPASPFVAAWGSPPAVLSCGVPGVAATYRPDVTLAVVDDVGWFSEDIGDTVRYSTPTRHPQVVLVLPASVQAFDMLVTLAAPVRDATRSTVP